MLEAEKRRILQQATEVIGREQLAGRLGVPVTVLEAWQRGESSMPDGQLLKIAIMLDDLGRQKRGG